MTKSVASQLQKKKIKEVESKTVTKLKHFYKGSVPQMILNEFTQCFNLAKALGLISSSRKIDGLLYVYNAAGQSKSWDSFAAEYPLERLQAMVSREQTR